MSKSKVSTLIAEELQKFNKKFCKRVVTRWNSILFMIRSVVNVTDAEFKAIRHNMPKKTALQISTRDKFKLDETERNMLLELKEILFL